LAIANNSLRKHKRDLQSGKSTSSKEGDDKIYLEWLLSLNFQKNPLGRGSRVVIRLK
jgi:hypothetical protein